MDRKRNKLKIFYLITNKNSPLFISINDNYISGFIAGDGSIGIYPFSLIFESLKFCNIFLSITQHKNNFFLTNEIKDYF